MRIKFTNGNVLKFAMLVCLLMTSCGTEVPFPRCVSGDNFNSSTTIAVSAYYSEGNVDAFKADNGEIGNGSTPGSVKQIVRWKDTGLVTDGEEIIIKVTGAWVPWEKNGEKKSPPVAVNTGISRPVDLADEFYDAVVDVNRVCGPFEQTTRQVGKCPHLKCYHVPDKDEEGKGKYGRPCWMENGYGAYLLFKRPEDGNPNATLDIIEYPSSPTSHLGYEGTDKAAGDYYSSKDTIFDGQCQNITPQRGWKIYVKILDNYYYDNAGGYSLEFKKGVIQGARSDIFETVRKRVRDELDKAGQMVFTNIVSNKSFRGFVLGIATLFILITALSYLLGMVRSPLPDVIVRVLKIVLVVMLISPGSWNFFYNHLLQLFLKGVDEIIAVINSYAVGQNFEADKPFSFMDVMIRDRIFAPVVWEAKARALITADKISIFALLLIGIAVLFYIGLCLYGFIIYLTAFVGITFLISLMPILFAGILFAKFKSLFDGWLTQCISFSMQAILMFTLIAMFGSLIMHYYYRIFGFTACYNEWIHAKIYVLGMKIIDQKYYEWTPGQEYDPIIIRIGGIDDQENKGIARYRFTGGGSVIRVPPDFKEEDFRYVDMPFLDPDTTTQAPPGGVSLKDNQDAYKKIASLTNSLVAAERSTGIARLVGSIEKELESLKTSGKVTDAHKKAFTDILSDNKYGKTQGDRWKSKELKSELLNKLTSHILTTATHPSTSYTELEKQYDYSIIKSIKQGYLVMWPEVFGLILVAFLVWQMRAFVQSVAVVLAGGGMMSTVVASMYDEGFTRIFSRMPVFGRAIEFVDYGIDSVRVMARARIDGVTSAIARAPEKMLGRVPVIGGAMETFVRGVRNTATALTAPNDEAEMYSMRSISPDFDYARAWVGAHLGFSPLDALQYMGSYAMGSATGGLLHNIKRDREALLSNIKTLTKGVDKYEPNPYVLKDKEEGDDVVPWGKTDIGSTGKGVKDVFGGDLDHGGGGPGPSKVQQLFDSSGNIHVHSGNFDTAVDALHGLNVMRRNAEDSLALQKIDHDIDALKGAIGSMAKERGGDVPDDVKKFMSPEGEIDFAGLIAVGAMHRLRQQEKDDTEGLETPAHDGSSEQHARDMADTSLLIGDNEQIIDLGASVFEQKQEEEYVTTSEFRYDVPADTEGLTESGVPDPNTEVEERYDVQAKELEEAHKAYESAFDDPRTPEDDVVITREEESTRIDVGYYDDRGVTFDDPRTPEDDVVITREEESSRADVGSRDDRSVTFDDQRTPEDDVVITREEESTRIDVGYYDDRSVTFDDPRTPEDDVVITREEESSRADVGSRDDRSVTFDDPRTPEDDVIITREEESSRADVGEGMELVSGYKGDEKVGHENVVQRDDEDISHLTQESYREEERREPEDYCEGVTNLFVESEEGVREPMQETGLFTTKREEEEYEESATQQDDVLFHTEKKDEEVEQPTQEDIELFSAEERGEEIEEHAQEIAQETGLFTTKREEEEYEESATQQDDVLFHTEKKDEEGEEKEPVQEGLFTGEKKEEEDEPEDYCDGVEDLFSEGKEEGAEETEVESPGTEDENRTEIETPDADVEELPAEEETPSVIEELEDYCEGLKDLFGDEQLDIEGPMEEGQDLHVTDQHETRVEPIIKPRDVNEGVKSGKSSFTKEGKEVKGSSVFDVKAKKAQKESAHVAEDGSKKHEKLEQGGILGLGKKKGKAKKEKGDIAAASGVASIGQSVKDVITREAKAQIASILKKLGFDGDILKTSHEEDELKSKEYDLYISQLESQVESLKKLLTRENVDRAVSSSIRDEIDSIERKISQLKKNRRGN